MRRWRSALLVVSVVFVLPSCTPFPRLPSPLGVSAGHPGRSVPAPPPRVLIVGDSIADQSGSHAAVALREVGINVRVASWWGWGLFTRSEYDMGATVVHQPSDTMMSEVIKAVDEFDPDVIAIYSNHNYWPPYPRDAQGHTITMGTPAFTTMVQTQLRALFPHLTAHGAAVYMIKPLPTETATAAQNRIWTAYAALKNELGFGIVNAGDIVADPVSHGWTPSFDNCAGVATAVRPADHLHLTYFGSGLMGTVIARVLANALGISLEGSSAPTDKPAAMLPAGDGYRLVSCDGATFGFGTFEGTLGGAALGPGRAPGDPVVAAAPAPLAGGGGRRGAWLVTTAGRTIGLGGAPTFGDVTGLARGRHAVGIAATASGRGYWIATDHGQVRPFGDAAALGGFTGTNESTVAMVGTPDHAGYWLLTDAGRVVGFGSARVFGDLRGHLPTSPVVDIAAHPSGRGYWVLDRAGNVHPFGAATGHGSAANQNLLKVVAWNYPDDFVTQPVRAADAPTTAVALQPTTSGNGYWVWLANGAVCHFGDAATLGGLHRAHINFSMRLLGVPFYGPGACAQSSDSPQSELSQATRVESQDLPLRPSDAAAADAAANGAAPG
jgi:hypothetical protein